MVGVAVRRRVRIAVCNVLIGVGAIVTGAEVAPGQEVGAPDGQDLVISPGDLRFVLHQIRIAEDHAEDVVTENPDSSPLCGPDATFDDSVYGQVWTEPDGDVCVGSPLLPHGLRTVDGRWNNLQPGQSTYGAGGVAFPRLLTPELRPAQAVPPGAPSVPGQPNPTTYEQTSGFVYDSEPRTISNLIVDQTTDNPAAVAKLLEFLADGLDARIIDDDGNELPIPEPPPGEELTPDDLPEGRIFLQNVATDEGLSAPFSSWMTIFGQFFDHGLDLVEKGGNGTVVVPLQPDDPLADHPDFATAPPYLMLTRATNRGDSHEHTNLVTPFIDQNQTYTSHASHQVFLREYEMVDGAPVPTGMLLSEPDVGGIATWQTVKDQALEMLGIELVDQDALAVPLVRTDPYGRFVPDPASGFPQVATAAGFVSGTPADPVDTADAFDAGVAFLDDIAHTAVPTTAGYDADLLADHFVTGDGRGNENIALTAAHHVFHSEHDRLIGQIEAVLEADADDPDGLGLAEGYAAEGFWDESERLFQAARFFNEMQYQHLAVEEFLRAVAPTMDVQPLNESAYHSELDAAITAEFAHVVYRFGHSMLTETLPRIYEDGSESETTLLDGFLNPRAFTEDGDLDPDEAAGSLIRGLAGQVGNGIDEFVTDTLRNELLGLPLDLATINLARGRDVGVPPLQSARAQFYAATLDPTLAPYISWEDFRLELKHRASIVNFIAAYGTGDATLDGATSLADKRARATELAADQAYMNRPAAETGLDDVDFWVGGLAERTMVFGGMLGSTFNHVFESQAELLQNADRFYYLTRNQGLNFLAQLEGNSFSELIQRNTTAEAVPLDIFAFPGSTIYLDRLAGDPSTWPVGIPEGFTRTGDGTYRYDGGEHIVVWGTEAGDRIRGGDGDDHIWGRADRDVMQGGDGADSLVGGDGDDLIDDIFGDDKVIAGAGNDTIRGGPGEDLILSGSGNDYTLLIKDDLNTNFAGAGNDWILGGSGNDRVWGGDGDDWMEGGQGHDLLQGDHAVMFQNDPYGGHDVLIGGPGNNDLDSDGGDDIMVGGPGVDRYEGMLGYDWVTFKNQNGVTADMRFVGLLPGDVAALRQRFDLIEGLSGSPGNDILRGLTGIDDVVEGTEGHDLTEANLDRIAGLRALLQPPGHRNYACRFTSGQGVCDIPQADSDGISNLILGGAGSDIIEGRQGDDFLDGDAWLDVQIEWVNPDGPNERFNNLLEIGTRTLDGEINPGDLVIRRSIKTPTGQTGLLDTVEYLNASTEYELMYLGDGYWEVGHTGAAELEESDGFDVVHAIELLEFPDRCVVLPERTDPIAGLPEPVSLADAEDCSAVGSITLDQSSPVEDQPIVATATITGVTNPTELQWHWQFGEDGEEWEPSPNPSSNDGLTSTFHPRDAEPGNHLRAVLTFLDDDGVLRRIISPRTPDPVQNLNDAPVGPEIVPADPVVGDYLTAIGLSDDDGIEAIVEDLLVTYRWQRSADGTGWSDIATTSTPFFPVTADLEGDLIRVVAEYTDDHDTAEAAVSAPTAPVGAEAPNQPSSGLPALVVATPRVGEEVSVDVSAIDDPDGIHVDDSGNPVFGYQWQRLAAGDVWPAIPGATGPTFTPTADLVGQRIRVVVSYTDLRGKVESLASEASSFVEPELAVPPTVSLDSPLAGSVVSGIVGLVATSPDAASVAFAVDGASVGVDSDGSDGWTAHWDATSAAVGDHTITVTATGLGGLSTSASVTVSVAEPVDAPPSVAITSPEADASVKGVVTVTADASDDVGVAEVRVAIDGFPAGSDTDGSDGWAVRVNTAAIGGDGAPHEITVTAVDGAGQTADASVSVTVLSNARSDFDGDGATDIAVFRNGSWFVRGQGRVNHGRAGDIPVPGDYDGDGVTERVVFRPSTMRWIFPDGSWVRFGASTDLPVPGDYDGDGATDMAVFRSNGGWFVRGADRVNLGRAGDIPVPGDYDGDGVTERAVYRPSTGQWLVEGMPTVQHGTATDVPVPGDYDGDGDTDVAVFRDGTWLVSGASDVVLGAAGDIPVPGDFDGDGDAERAVFRPATAEWFIEGRRQSIPFGASTDVPVAG